MTDIVVPSSVTDIDWGAFENCSSLKSVKIESGTITIDARAFVGCHSLEEIYVAASVTAIDLSAFENCVAVKKVTLPRKFEKEVEEIFDNNSSDVAENAERKKITFAFI